MIELTMVLIVLGIVGSISASMIADTYRAYLLQRSLYRASIQTQLAAQQIANRLVYRLPISVIGKNPSNLTDYMPVDMLPANDTIHVVLEWIGYDGDSFETRQQPGWSGVCDINNSSTTRTSYITPGSDLGFTDTVIQNLGGTGVGDAAIVFSGLAYAPSKNYHPSCMGNTDTTCISPVTASGTTGTVINVTDNRAKTVHDQYKLAWSAYALVPVDDGNGSFDLWLHYNYQPWQGENYTQGERSLIAKRVTVFKFRGANSGDILRFKLCTRERLGDQNISICKEKAVIR